jgi:hypothetical protein
MTVTFLPDRVDDYLSTAPRHYTSAPLSLVRIDILLFFRNFFYLLNIILPLGPWPSGELDELKPSGPNLVAIALHLLLVILQVGFIISLPICLFLPLSTVVVYIAVFFAINAAICKIINGRREDVHVSKTDLSRFPRRENESWIFLNGVAVGYALDWWSPLIHNYFRLHV